MKEMNIIIIGHRATGKGLIGKALAKALGYGFLDTDDMIEEKEGKTVLEIFQERGEPHFRRLECQAIKKACSKKKCVIATGDGVPLAKQNFDEIRKRGIVVLLESTPEEITSRMREEPPRPALTDMKMLEETKFLLKKRTPTYRALADCIIKTNGKKVEENVREIMEFLKEKKHI
jgi:shikimate kinase